MRRRFTLLVTTLLLTLACQVAAACGSDDEYITIYAGRSQQLVGPLLDEFVRDTGIKIRVRYGDGTDLALGILEEGKNSPVDVYYGQDVGSLGALKAEDRLAKLPQTILDKVPAGFRSPDGYWVGISGRSRVIVYNTDDIDPRTLPKSILEYTDPRWKDRLGFVPRSDGFPEFVTALRVTRGQEFALNWLRGLKANNARAYGNNLSALSAVANNEIDVAFLNHYYLYRFLAERGEGFKARNYYFDNGDIGGLFLVSGAAVLNTSKKQANAQTFVDYLLSEKAQQYLANRDYEYPLLSGVKAGDELPPLSSLKAPDIDLSDLGDLKGSLELMRQAGILP
jgi:iron(III) transport system substrate-binding protein